jgi:hypothetical protein
MNRTWLGVLCLAPTMVADRARKSNALGEVALVWRCHMQQAQFSPLTFFNGVNCILFTICQENNTHLEVELILNLDLQFEVFTV